MTFQERSYKDFMRLICGSYADHIFIEDGLDFFGEYSKKGLIQ
jgi:hypothetical protein